MFSGTAPVPQLLSLASYVTAPSIKFNSPVANAQSSIKVVKGGMLKFWAMASGISSTQMKFRFGLLLAFINRSGSDTFLIFKDSRPKEPSVLKSCKPLEFEKSKVSSWEKIRKTCVKSVFWEKSNSVKFVLLQ